MNKIMFCLETEPSNNTAVLGQQRLLKNFQVEWNVLFNQKLLESRVHTFKYVLDLDDYT